MESIDPANMADVNKTFSKPANYQAVLDGLARRNIYAITSFIFGMDNDTVGVGDRTVDEIESWPPGLPVFGQLTPFPATPLYERLEKAGRLNRPKHWLDFAPFVMAHEPLKMSVEEARQETRPFVTHRSKPASATSRRACSSAASISPRWARGRGCCCFSKTAKLSFPLHVKVSVPGAGLKNAGAWRLRQWQRPSSAFQPLYPI
jgi:hypothetical protein